MASYAEKIYSKILELITNGKLNVNSTLTAQVDIDSADVTSGINNSNIATNTDTIATNTGNTATNTGNIATNTSNTATNTGNIATSAAKITRMVACCGISFAIGTEVSYAASQRDCIVKNDGSSDIILFVIDTTKESAVAADSA